MIRMIVSDLDMTLTGKNGEMSVLTAEIIRRSQQMGISWVIATGRGFETVKPVLKKADIDLDMILLNGAEYRSCNGEKQYYEALPQDICEELITFFTKRNIDLEINTSEGNYATAPRLLDDSSDLIPFQEYRKGTAYILKIFAFSKDYENIQKAKEKLKGRTDIHVTSSAPWNVEITSPAADKFQMVKRIIDENATSSEEVMVFGDGVNDACLFREFCHSRAVANAVPQIINMAEKVVADCEENGVAREVAEMFSISL